MPDRHPDSFECSNGLCGSRRANRRILNSVAPGHHAGDAQALMTDLGERARAGLFTGTDASCDSTRRRELTKVLSRLMIHQACARPLAIPRMIAITRLEVGCHETGLQCMAISICIVPESCTQVFALTSYPTRGFFWYPSARQSVWPTDEASVPRYELTARYLVWQPERSW